MVLKRHQLILILGGLAAVMPMTVDMYLPALPTLVRDFHTGPNEVQNTLTSFFIGVAVGQTLFGPVSDRFGRRAPLLVGLGLYLLASLGCAFSPVVGSMILFRFVQALGACAAQVCARAVVRDLFQAQEAARMFSTMMLVNGMAPILAPVLGGILLTWLGWPSLFWFMACYGMAFLFCVLIFLSETHAPDPTRSLALSRILKRYWILLGDRIFLGNVLAGAFSQAGMFAYIGGTPFVFIELHHVTPREYGLLFGLNSIGIVLTSQINSYWLKRTDPATLLRIANFIQAAAGTLLLASALTGVGGFLGILVPIFVFVSCIGVTFPNAAALAMAPHGEHAGAASALLGTLQFGLAAISTTLLASFHAQSAIPMASLIAGCGLLSVILRRMVVGNRRL